MIKIWQLLFSSILISGYTAVGIKSAGINITFNKNVTNHYNIVYSILNEKINNQTLNLESDYSTSLEDEHNKIKIKNALDELIKKELGDYYILLKLYEATIDYAYSDITNQTIITIKIDKHIDKPIRWDFQVTIKFSLSEKYWEREMSERLKIITGKIINPNNPNGEMIDDTAIEWNDKKIYSTTASIRFDGLPDGSETMKVNGVPIQVIDNTFTFQMTDNQEHETNEYHILIEKHDLKNFNKNHTNKYEINYVIRQDIPNLDLKWYAWNPAKNPDQRKLVEPILPNGKANPNYDPEVNSKTGTKTQIMWIKHKAENPFPLDPLDKNGNRIIDKKFEEGFLAEGSVSGMGIAQNFSNPWIKSIQRIKVDEKTLLPTGPLEKIQSDNNNSYFSLSGTYLYILTDQKNHTSNKFITIGQQWQEKYIKFLDILDNPDVAIPFWSSLQGFHLKNYLAKYKNLTTKKIQSLTFEKVSSYWKEYVSDVKTQHISPDDKPGNNFDLKDIKFETIKMNKTTITEIRNEIIKQVEKQLLETDLIYNVDYFLRPLTDKNLQKLLNYDNKGKAAITLNINALETSTRIIGYNKIKIINSTHYDPKTVIDLSTVKFAIRQFNFSSFTVEQLKAWIFQDINQTFEFYQISLDYPDDYDVKPLDDATLNQFLTNKNYVSLKFTIYSQDNSMKVKNSTTLELVNDSDAIIVPSNPPEPNPIPWPPNKNSSWITKNANLILMTVISILIISILTTIIFFKYRLKKGIGIKKND